MKRFLLIAYCFLFLTGCWSNIELDETALVHGVGIDKTEDNMLNISFEIVKPGGNQNSRHGSTQDDNNQMGGEHIILELKTNSLLDGARESIKYTKRKLDFGHTEAWIIGEELAKENFIRALDVVRRDQMLRLNSHIFITKDDPANVLNTSTLYENLVATELAASIEQTQFMSEYSPITLRGLYKLLEGPIRNGYIPIISIEEVHDNQITAIEGTAVIKKDRMIGELDRIETAGLNILLDRVKGGSIRTFIEKDELVSLEVISLKTKTTSTLKEKSVEATIDIKVKGTLGDNMTFNKKVDRNFLQKVEKAISERTKKVVQTTLQKLQQDLKTDITHIGIRTHKDYPKEWRYIQSNWNEIFANAKVTINVETNVVHKGLINENIHPNEKSQRNPYLFWKK